MSAEFFIDTNVFIYRLDRTDERKHAVADDIIREALATGKGDGCISSQVVQECLHVALRKAEVPFATLRRPRLSGCRAPAAHADHRERGAVPQHIGCPGALAFRLS